MGRVGSESLERLSKHLQISFLQVFAFEHCRMASNGNYPSWPILEFNGEDYEYWLIKMKTLLIGKGFLEIVEDGYDEPTDWTTLQRANRISRREAQKKNSFALYHLQMVMDKSIFPRKALFTLAKDAWKA